MGRIGKRTEGKGRDTSKNKGRMIESSNILSVLPGKESGDCTIVKKQMKPYVV